MFIINIENTAKYIYSNCSSRITERTIQLGLSNRAIYPVESKIIGRIKRCKIEKKRNPYLIQENVKEVLKDKLNYNSFQDMLWGSDEEIHEYLPTLFLTVMTDLVKKDSPYKDIVNSVLCNYIPYAKYLGYYHVLFECESAIPRDQLFSLYNIDKTDFFLCIDNYFSGAVNYIYYKCHKEFYALYISFVKKHNSFKRWTYRFCEWIKDKLIPLLRKYTPSENSLGNRIKNIIYTDYTHISTYLLTNDPDEKEAIKLLLMTTGTYIDKLELLQKSYPYFSF